MSPRRPSGTLPRMTPSDQLTDAEALYLARIREDCELLLGPGVEVLDVRREPADEGVRVVLRYQLGMQQRESAAAGETMLAAHAALRDRIVVDRLRFGYADLVEQR